MALDEEYLKNQLIECGIEAFFKGLVWGSSGNLSSRLNKKRFLISGASAYLDKLEHRDFISVSLEDGTWEGAEKPSIETKMHAEIYKTRNDAEAVFHSQPFFTTFVSCTNLDVNTALFPESMAYLGKIEKIPYHHPGSGELAKTVSKRISECGILILSNHGAICVAESLEELLVKTETLEMLCRMIVFSNIGEIKLNFLSQAIKDDFLRHLKEVK